jgi:hypothetical protein
MIRDDRFEPYQNVSPLAVISAKWEQGRRYRGAPQTSRSCDAPSVLRRSALEARDAVVVRRVRAHLKQYRAQ